MKFATVMIVAVAALSATAAAGRVAPDDLDIFVPEEDQRRSLRQETTENTVHENFQHLQTFAPPQPEPRRLVAEGVRDNFPHIQTFAPPQREPRRLVAEGVRDNFPHIQTFAPPQREPRRLAEEGRFKPHDADDHTFVPPSDSQRKLNSKRTIADIRRAARDQTFAPPRREPL